MSFSFYIHNVKDLDFSRVIQLVNRKSLRCAEIPDMASQDRWPESYLHFHEHGLSCRAVEICFENNLFEVRVMSASSPDDYLLAAGFVEAVSMITGEPVEPEDADPTEIDAFRLNYDREWARRHSYETIDIVSNLYQSEQTDLTLSGATRNFKLGPRTMVQLPDDPDEFREAFIGKFRRLQYIEEESVFVSAVIVMANPDNDDEIVRAGIYGDGEATMLTARAEVVCVQDDDEDVAHIPFEALPEVFGDALEWLSDDTVLIRAMDRDELAVAMSRAKPHHIDIDECYHPDDGVDGAPPTESDVRLVQYSPLLVFLIMAARDGRINKKRVRAFARVMGEILDTADGPLKSVIAFNLVNITDMFEELMREKPDVVAMINQLATVLDRQLEKDAAYRFKYGLMDIARKVAMPPKGLLGFRKRQKSRDTQLLAALEKMLGLVG